MSRGTADIEDHRLRHKGEPQLQKQRPVDSDAVRLAAVASMNMARQSPGLVLPSLANVPTSYTRVGGAASALDMARSVIQLGLGSPTVWNRSNSPVHFIKAAINQWLEENGSSRLTDNVSFDLAILGALDDNLPKREGDFFILIETNDGCGYMEIGKAVDRLESLHTGLGVSFYVVLMDTMWNWMSAYDICAAGYFFDRWRESIEMEITDAEDSSVEQDQETAFRAFCKENSIDFPDLREATPPCLRDVPFHKQRKRLKRHLAVLEEHKSGTYADLIEPVLAMAAVLQRGKSKVAQQDLADMWDDQPLPNWVVAFEKHDPVTQAFDEEARSMQESSHAPCWIDTFNPADAKDVFRVLSHVKDFLTVNLQMVKVSKATAALSKKEKTMQAQIDISSTQSFELRNALLVYENRGGSFRSNKGPAAFVTTHPVMTTPDGSPTLGLGQPISKDDIAKLIESLRGSIPVEFLPANVLVRTDDNIVWWTPRSIRPMFYAEEKAPELKELSGKRLPQPALIFRLVGGELSMRALATTERPTPETPVYRVPYWNVNEEGVVCLGSTRVPREASADNVSAWEYAFFQSRFTHSNCFRCKLTEHPEGFVGLWRSLIGKKRFPTEHLADARQKLGEFIKM